MTHACAHGNFGKCVGVPNHFIRAAGLNHTALYVWFNFNLATVVKKERFGEESFLTKCKQAQNYWVEHAHAKNWGKNLVRRKCKVDGAKHTSIHVFFYSIHVCFNFCGVSRQGCLQIGKNADKVPMSYHGATQLSYLLNFVVCRTRYSMYCMPQARLKRLFGRECPHKLQHLIAWWQKSFPFLLCSTLTRRPRCPASARALPILHPLFQGIILADSIIPWVPHSPAASFGHVISAGRSCCLYWYTDVHGYIDHRPLIVAGCGLLLLPRKSAAHELGRKRDCGSISSTKVLSRQGEHAHLFVCFKLSSVSDKKKSSDVWPLLTYLNFKWSGSRNCDPSEVKS